MSEPQGNGVRRSAIVLLAMGAEQADQVLRRLPDDAVKRVTRDLHAAGVANASRGGEASRAAILSDFLLAAKVALEGDAVEGDGPSGDDRNHDERAASSVSASPFAALQDAETATLLDSIREEHPQTVALVLAHLPPDKAGEVLAGLSPARQVEVVKRIAGIEQISAEVIDQVERGLRQRLGHIMGRTIRAGGVSAVAEILNSADRRVEREILDTLAHDAPQLVEQIRRVQAIFEDLLHARDADIRAVLEQLDHETISLSLRTAREGFKRKVMWNLPAEEARQIEQELQSVEPVRISEIEAAQQRVAEVVHRLESAGEIGVLHDRARGTGERVGGGGAGERSRGARRAQQKGAV